MDHWEWGSWKIPRDRKKARESLIEERLALFIETENPLHAWEVVDLCTRREPILSLPKEVAQYLHSTADRMLKVAQHTPKSPAKQMLGVLGFEGSRVDDFKNYHRAFVRRDVCNRIARKVRVEKMPVAAAVTATANEFKISDSQVYKFMDEMCPDRGKKPWPKYLSAHINLILLQS